jgi:hypothetical protein
MESIARKVASDLYCLTPKRILYALHNIRELNGTESIIAAGGCLRCGVVVQVGFEVEQIKINFNI